MTPTLDAEREGDARDDGGEDLRVGPALLKGSVRIADPRWAGLEPGTLAELVLSAVAGSSVAPVALASCDILFTDDAEMADLNGRFRSMPRPTNVLAFPSGEPIQRAVPAFLGGIALSYDRVVAEAGERRLTATAHATHLTLHGLLHLIGYDHEDAADREEMERVEIHILAGLGIDNPYEGS